jgi:hypothetical protein
MEKRYRKMQKKVNGKIREIKDGRVLLELPLPMAEVIGGISGVVKELTHEVGLLIVSAAMTSECERIAGPKDSKNPLRTANWWGSELSPIYYDDRQKVLIDRPRLRSKDNKEIPLDTYKAFRDPKGH